MKLPSILSLLLMFSCSAQNYKTVDFGSFEITLPEDWHKFEATGIDSYIGGVITSSNDTLKFDFGMYSSDLTSSDFPMVYDSVGLAELSKKERELLPKTKHLIVDNITGDINFKEYMHYQARYDSIGCFKAKIITPRNKGYGGAGVYIDSIRGTEENFSKVKFSFYGWYLSEKTQAEFLKAIKTLHFKKYCSQQDL